MVLLDIPPVSICEPVKPTEAAITAPDRHDFDTYRTNDSVDAIAIAPDGTTYIGGQFDRVGPNIGADAPIDTTSGSPAPNIPRVNGTVEGVVSDGTGGWVIGEAAVFLLSNPICYFTS